MTDIPRRVVAASQMNDEAFARHLALRHPGLKLPGHRYRHRFQSKARERAARDAHLQAHRQFQHAHCHVGDEVIDFSASADVERTRDRLVFG